MRVDDEHRVVSIARAPHNEEEAFEKAAKEHDEHAPAENDGENSEFEDNSKFGMRNAEFEENMGSSGDETEE